MDKTEMTAMYRSFCRMPIVVRRYSMVGDVRTPFDFEAMGHARLYGGKDLVGGIVQGDQQVIIIADDLEAAGLELPLRNTDKVIPGVRELAIVGAPGERKSLDGGLVAYDLQARG